MEPGEGPSQIRNGEGTPSDIPVPVQIGQFMGHNQHLELGIERYWKSFGSGQHMCCSILHQLIFHSIFMASPTLITLQ